MRSRHQRHPKGPAIGAAANVFLDSLRNQNVVRNHTVAMRREHPSGSARGTGYWRRYCLASSGPGRGFSQGEPTTHIGLAEAALR
ncbi:hypothetical protein SHIRM173S_05631 [Streptomyces hirsutus]